MATACDGVRVVDFSRGMAGNLASMTLADYGAEVVRVEPPGGDPWRAFPAWQLWNRGKRSVELDLKSEQGRAAAHELLAGADVALVSFRPGVGERLGIDYPTLKALNPQLIYGHITGFGTKSPWANLKGYEGIVNAKTGRHLSFAGIAERPGPGYAAVPSGTFGASQGAIQGILVGLYARRKTGLGCQFETSLLQGNTAYDMMRWIGIQVADEQAFGMAREAASSPAARAIPRPNYLTAVTKDGVWLQLANTMPHLFAAQMAALDLLHLYADPRYVDLPRLKDPADSEGVWEAVLDRIRSKTWAEWREILEPHTNVCVEPFRTTQETPEHPQVQHNGHFIRVGDMEQVGPLVNQTETPASPSTPAPALDQDADWLAGRPWEPKEKPKPTGVKLGAPLEGVTIVDFANYYATPFGTSLLADYGARVIKVESTEGDYSRFVVGTLGYKTTGGKEGLSVDLKSEEGKEIGRKLVAQADIVLHNFRPGAPELLGIAYEDVNAVNPDVVYHYGASYGSTGPSCLRPAFHPAAGAIAGGAILQMPPSLLKKDYPELPMDALKEKAWRLLKANEGNPDVNAALGIGSGLLLGLQARDALGVGQYQETTMICANLHANAEDAFRYEGKPPRAEPDELLYGLGPLYRLYLCTDDTWVFLACVFDKEWDDLCQALGRADWGEDSRFATAAARSENAAALASELETIFLTRHADDWEKELVAADVACARADERDVAQFAMRDSSNLEQGFTVEVEHPAHGRYLRHGAIAIFDIAPGREGPLCDVGEHTRPILKELGYSDSEIARLKEAGVVTWTDEEGNF